MKNYKTINEICEIADISRQALYKRIKVYESENGSLPKEYTSGGIRIFDNKVSEVLINPERRKPGRKKIEK